MITIIMYKNEFLYREANGFNEVNERTTDRNGVGVTEMIRVGSEIAKRRKQK